MCCKNIFCKDHVKTFSSIVTEKQCPICYSEKFEAFPDAQADEKIQALMVYCPNKDAGCSWVGEVSQVNKHCNSDHVGCLYQEIKCPSKCGISLQRKDVENHLMVDCPCYCQHCNITGDERMIAEQHKEICQKFTTQCPNGCGVATFRENINEHRKVCPLEEIKCEYHSLGCKSIMLRKNKEDHNEYNAVKHLDLLKQNISYSTSHSHWLPYILALFLLVVMSYVITELYGSQSIKYEMESKYHEIESKHYEMELKYREMNAKLSHEMELRYRKMNAKLNHEMELKYHKMIDKLSQQLNELKKENRKLKVNISDKYEVLKTAMTRLKYLENKVKECVTLEEFDFYISFLDVTVNSSVEKINELTKGRKKVTESLDRLENSMNKGHRNLTVELNRLTENIDKLENTLKKSFRNLSATVDRTNKQKLSDMWYIHLSILHLLALHNNQVVPVVLVISNYSEWVKENETWYSPFFKDKRHGNQFYLSVKPVKTDLSIALHFATYSKKYGLRNGIFIIEVLNLIDDSNHSVGKIHFSNATSFVSKTDSDTKLLERKLVGNLNHSIPHHQKNAMYILRDELFLRVSFISDN